MKIRLYTSLFFIAILAGLPGCGESPDPAGGSGAAGPVDGGTVVIAFASEPDVLNPLLYRSAHAGQILVLLMDSLVEMGDDLVYHPWIARSLEPTGDGRGLTATLREWTWQDGTPLTAEDVVSSVALYMDPVIASPRSGGRLANIREIEALDPRTVRYIFHEVRADMVPTLGHFILPKHLTDTYAPGDVREWPINETPLSSGMFVLETWDHDRRLVLLRNETYKGRKPHVARLIFRIIPDETARWVELETGDVDFVEDVPTHVAARLGENPDIVVDSIDGRLVGQVYWNMELPIFRDRRVRKAFSLAIDRRRFVEGLMDGFARPASSPLPPALWAHDPDLAPDPHDPAAASRLLADAGWVDSDGDGIRERDGRRLSFTMITRKGDPVRENGLQIIRENLASVGAEVDGRVLEFSTAIDLVRSGRFDAYLGVFSARLAVDPSDLLASDAFDRFNYGHYASAAADSLMDLALSLTDRDQARPVWHAFQRLVAHDAPMACRYYPASLVAYNRRLSGVEPHILSPYNNIRDWWIAPASRKYE